MNSIVKQKLEELVKLCIQHRVKRLTLFGSALEEEHPRDLDFTVEFMEMPPVEHADCYLALLENLEHLFGMKIDLVEPGPIRNPYFLKSLKESQVVLYNAA